jgi:hypothetical protein
MPPTALGVQGTPYYTTSTDYIDAVQWPAWRACPTNVARNPN